MTIKEGDAMTEQYAKAAKPYKETTAPATVELHHTQIAGRRERELGNRAVFDGFMLMERSESPYEDIRRKIKETVVEQDTAIDALIEALERSEVRLPHDKRPIANLAFLGPTGVGKSEVAKTLARLLAEDDLYADFIKIDCSDFSQGHEVMRLVGSPPSYVGHDQEPILAKEKVENGKTVILFDEIEKGSPRLYNLMLQIMGDGQLGLNNGDLVSFRECVIIITSNLGAKEMSTELSPLSLGFGNKNGMADKAKLDSVATKSFTDFFTPEFINRLNKMVVFHPLSLEGLGHVLDVKLGELNDEYTDTYGAKITLTNKTREHLVGIAQKQPHLGARPLVRALEDNVQTTFGRYTGTGKIHEGTHVRVFHRDELPKEHSPEGDDLLVFTSKRDRTIKKYRRPAEITATPHTEAANTEESAENAPEPEE